MILKTGDPGRETVWHIHIHHEFLEDDSHEPRRKRKSWDVVSRALVHTGPCVLTYATPKYCVNGHAGEVYCSKKDSFVRSVGAKLALRAALEKLPRETREAIWQVYWLRVRRPKERHEKFRRRLEAISKAA